jgi:hypothetical protein
MAGRWSLAATTGSGKPMVVTVPLLLAVSASAAAAANAEALQGLDGPLSSALWLHFL